MLMDLQFLKYIDTVWGAIAAIVIVAILKPDFLSKIGALFGDKKHKEETAELIKNSLILQLWNALRYSPMDETYIRDLWKKCEEYGVNGGNQRAYEAWEANHCIHACPLKMKKNENMCNRKDVPKTTKTKIK